MITCKWLYASINMMKNDWIGDWYAYDVLKLSENDWLSRMSHLLNIEMLFL